jgi:hypothetical protein
MEKTRWLKRTNVVLFFVLVYQAVTGALVELIDPDIFGVIHPAGGVLLVLVGIVHISLNWGWVRAVFLKKGLRQV